MHNRGFCFCFSILFSCWTSLGFALSDEPSAKVFDAKSSQQKFIVGAEALYRLLVEDWQARIQSTHRGVETYGGPLWFLTYSKDQETFQSLTASKESDAQLTIHPNYMTLARQDDNIRIVHKLKPQGLTLTDTATIENISNVPIKIWHYQIWNFYYTPVLKPDLTSITRPRPGYELWRAWLSRSLLKENVEYFPGEPKKLHVERKYLLPGPRNKVNDSNHFPASSLVTFNQTDDVFDLFAPLADPGSLDYVGRDSLTNLLHHEDRFGPVWVGLTRKVLAPGETLTLSSSHLLELGETVTVDPDQLAKMPVTPASQLYPSTAPTNFSRPEKWPALYSELVSSAYLLKSMSAWDELSGKVVTSQGAIYLNKIGLHTALRDFVHGLVGMSKTVPMLARSNLEYLFNLQDGKTGYMPYDWSGVMDVNQKSGIRPDFSPALIWGLVEVMKANPDWKWFFHKSIPFYPPYEGHLPDGASGMSPYQHAKAAFVYLRDKVGLGVNGLPKMHSGDWSDAINTLAGPLGSLDHLNSTLHGESVMVGQMAVVVLKDFIALLSQSPEPLSSEDNSFIAELGCYVSSMRDNLRRLYDQNVKAGHPFFPRAILRDALNRQKPVLADTLETGGQVWALMDVKGKTPILTEEERVSLLRLVLATNDTPLGVRTVIAPKEATADYFRLQSRPWSTIREWFTAALALNGLKQEAWKHFYKTSLTWHNELFGRSSKNELISGFDGWSLDGKAWDLRPLPMNNDRWNNVNHSGMFLWAADLLLEQDSPSK